MTTQEDFTVEATEVDAVTTQAENENSEEATNTQEEYDDLVLKSQKLEEDKENYRRAALKYKKQAKSEEVDLHDDDDDTEVKSNTSKSFTAEEVIEISTKAAHAALESERNKNEGLVKVNSELKRSLSGKAPVNGTSGEGAVDTTKTSTPYFSDSQKTFLKKWGVTEEEVMETKRRKGSSFMM